MKRKTKQHAEKPLNGGVFKSDFAGVESGQPVVKKRSFAKAELDVIYEKAVRDKRFYEPETSEERDAALQILLALIGAEEKLTENLIWLAMSAARSLFDYTWFFVHKDGARHERPAKSEG